MIIVVGSINLDLVADVERLPSPGETVPGTTFRTAPGGKGANQALAAARAGGQVRMIGAVGKDAFAVEALALLKAGSVDLTGVHEAHAATGVAQIFVDGKGENVIVVVPGANATVVPGDLARVDMRKGDVVLLQHEVPLETIEAALDAARAAGAVSILNTAPFRPDAAKLLAKADFVVANETEFDLYARELELSGKRREDRMSAFVQATGRTVVVTLGGDGVIALAGREAVASATTSGLPGDRDGEGVEGDRFFRVSAIAVTPVDTVGAGDTFCGYLATGLAEGLSLGEALRRAAAAGSLACTKPGAQPAIPLRAEVEAALNPG
jgi:ribokinase